jgi:hypothetical protein
MNNSIKTILFALAFVASLSAYSQDMIFLRNGEKIKANVKEVSDSEITFLYDKETVINKLPTSQISQIKFKSGRVQKFEATNSQGNNNSQGNPLLDAYYSSLGGKGQGNPSANTNYNRSPYTFNIPEPDYVGTILLLDDNGKVLGTLENQKTSFRANSDAGVFIIGIGSTKSRQYVKGEKSPFRIKKGKVLLLAKVINNQFNPNETIEIFKLDQGRKDRSIVVSESHTFGGSKSNEIDYLPFKAYPYKDSSFLIELDIEQAGEYAISLDGIRLNFNLFGID